MGRYLERLFIKMEIERLSLIDNRRERVFVAEYENNVIGYVHVKRYDTLYSETLVNILFISG